MLEIDEGAAQRVIFAVTLQAIKDHRHGDETATAWLEHDALPWLEVAGMPRDESDLRRALESKVTIFRGH